MLAAHARIQAESVLGINTDLWWEDIKNIIFTEVDRVSRDGGCELIITEKSNLNIDNWMNKNHFYLDKISSEMKKLGYVIETTVVLGNILYEVKIKW